MFTKSSCRRLTDGAPNYRLSRPAHRVEVENAVRAVVQAEPGIGALVEKLKQREREVAALRLTLAAIHMFVPPEHKRWDGQREYHDVAADPR